MKETLWDEHHEETLSYEKTLHGRKAHKLACMFRAITKTKKSIKT